MIRSKTCFILISIILLLGIDYQTTLFELQSISEEEYFINNVAERARSPSQKKIGTQSYTPSGAIRITSDSEFKTLCSAEGTIDDPCVITGYNITPTIGYEHLIDISGTTVYFHIADNLLNGNSTANFAIYLVDVIHGTIDNNIITNTYEGGIWLMSSNNNTISNNDCQNGISLTSSNNSIISSNTVKGRIGIGNSTNNTISNNIVNNGDGIGTETSTNTSISNNTVYNCTTGITVSGSSDITISHNIIYDNIDFYEAIGLGQSNNVIISYNTINNYSEGFALDFATHNTVANNTIYNCSHGFNIHTSSNYNSITQNVIHNCDTGIMFQDSDYNTIFYNDLSNNNQASDDGSDNIFANNYWSDWTGTGSYAIDGSAGNQDPSPLTNPFHISLPTITAPTSDTPILQGSIPIQWIASNDMFGHSINYSVFYSANDGIDWILLTSGLTITNYTFDTTIIADGSSILLKVQAIDSIGFITQSTSSRTFLILNGVSPPTVKAPNGGETLEGTETIEWTASLDPSGHTITYTVYYSSDNGATWTQLTSDLTSTSYSWDTTTVPDGLSYLIKVVAICSEGETREDVSDSTFAIQNLKETTSETSGIPILIFLLALVVQISVRKRKKS
ncbi:MAG: NosD domain-containing protein [Candidatus Hermodarchaeota archaeon]